MDGDLVKHLGGCHCGKVRFEVQAPTKLTVFNCNCSICVMKGIRPFTVPSSNFKLLQGEDNLTCYTYNTKQAQHFFCKTCGVESFYTPRLLPNDKGVLINCLDKGTLETTDITVIDFDGQNWNEAVEKYNTNIKEVSEDSDSKSDK
ncbi:centromere protein V-like isoform X2 [Acanthaster planci]|nr:centromere protein V-like isoform X2 [Acanthaster planci]